MIITDLYKIIITADHEKYNIIDPSFPIKIKVLDYNNNPVKNKSLSVESKYPDFISSTPFSSYPIELEEMTSNITVTTGDDGIATVYYTSEDIGMGYIQVSQSNYIFEKYQDTGWIHLTPTNTLFNDYYPINTDGSSNLFQYRVYNNYVEIRGILKNIQTSSFESLPQTICTLPSKYSPYTRRNYIGMGSSYRKMRWQVHENGNIILENYSVSTGTGQLTNGLYLNFYGGYKI